VLGIQTGRKHLQKHIPEKGMHPEYIKTNKQKA
jgi:hypothetical protein